MRGGTVLALGLLLSLGFAPAAAQDGTGTADVFLKERGGRSFAGQDILSRDGAGQTRSLIVHDRLVVIVKIQNDGDGRKFTITASGPENGFEVFYRRLGERGHDITTPIQTGQVRLDIRPGESQTIRVTVDATNAELGAEQLLFVSATIGDATDAALAKITKIS